MRKADQESIAPAPTKNPDQDSAVTPPMTKQEMKAQKKQHKLEEKAAVAHAKADKESAKAAAHNAEALKQENKATEATTKMNSPD